MRRKTVLPGAGSHPARVAVVAYTEFPTDPRVRREAMALAKNGCAVDVISLRPKTGPSQSDFGLSHLYELPLTARRGGKLRYAFQYSTFLLLSSALLLYLDIRNRFLLVHVHSLPDFQILSAMPLRLRGTPILLDLHEGMPEILAARFHLSQHSAWVRVAGALEQLSCRVANHVITANDAIRQHAVSRGCPPRRISVIYNAASPPRTEASADTMRENLGLALGDFIVHAGGVNPERDLETLLKAIALVPTSSPLSLVVAGDGEPEYLEQLKSEVERLHLSGRVMFVGKLSLEDASGLLSLSRIGLVTLEDNPLTQIALPTRVLEFVRLGKPLIVPRLSYLRQVLGDCAEYYTPGDSQSLARAIARELEDRPDRAGRVTRARQICARFDWSGNQAAFLEVCRALGVRHAT